MKNDVSFVLDTRLSLYEHQSTVNRNMPLRDLMYVAKVFEGLVLHKDLYSSKLISLPSPRFITFYNGLEEQPERREYHLSDAYEQHMNLAEAVEKPVDECIIQERLAFLARRGRMRSILTLTTPAILRRLHISEGDSF